MCLSEPQFSFPEAESASHYEPKPAHSAYCICSVLSAISKLNQLFRSVQCMSSLPRSVEKRPIRLSLDKEIEFGQRD